VLRWLVCLVDGLDLKRTIVMVVMSVDILGLGWLGDEKACSWR